MLLFRRLRKSLRRRAPSYDAIHNFKASITTAAGGGDLSASFEHELFNYTSGRWLYNESRRLSERHLKFDVPELRRAIAKAANRREDDIKSFSKLAEGGFNRTFEATMKDGLQVIARLPYASTLPKRYAVASEVATMDFVRAYGIPVPQIFAYQVTADNAVRSEYIIMEKVLGKEVGHTWYDMPTQDRKTITLDVTRLESLMLSISLPASGSIYYKRDLLESDRSVDIAGHNGFCVGPDTALSWWFDHRDALAVDRGPFVNAKDAMCAGAIKEMAWMRQFGRPRFPFDRHRRELLDYQKASCDEHVQSLEQYREISTYLVPRMASLLRPTVRHPDLQPHNIFVSDECKIVGLIDWQHCSVRPLFLQAGVPKYWQNTSDEPVVIEKPSLPADFEQMDADEQAQAMEEYRQRQLHLLYLGGTTRFNPQHIDAYLTKGVPFKRRIFERASAPWEGDNISLKADLILATRNWDGLTSHSPSEHSEESMTHSPCPIIFGPDEADSCLQLDLQLQEEDATIARVREGIGIGSDGWVPHEAYSDAVERNKYIRQKVADDSLDQESRELSMAHYPFDDHDEDE